MTRLASFWASVQAARFWLLAILIVAALAYLKGCDDGMDRVHAKYERQAAKIERQARKAGDTATVAKESRDAGFVQQQEELKDVAVQKSGDGVGRNTRAVLERMRDQQAAGDKAAR